MSVTRLDACAVGTVLAYSHGKAADRHSNRLYCTAERGRETTPMATLNRGDTASMLAVGFSRGQALGRHRRPVGRLRRRSMPGRDRPARRPSVRRSGLLARRRGIEGRLCAWLDAQPSRATHDRARHPPAGRAPIRNCGSGLTRLLVDVGFDPGAELGRHLVSRRTREKP